MSNSSQRVRQNRRLLAMAPVAIVAALALTACSNNEKPSPDGPGVGTLPPVFTPSAAPTAITPPDSDIGLVEAPALGAVLKNTEGQQVGTAEIDGTGLGISITVNVNNMTPGHHGLAIAAAGVCEAGGGFASAGDVLNDPANTSGVRDGDLPTLLVNANGNGSLTTTTDAVKVDELLNAPGTSIVVGADADSSSRIACGVIEFP